MNFQAIAWEGEDIEDQYVIRIFGRSDDGTSVSLGTNFNPYFFIKTPSDVKDFITRTFKVKSCRVNHAKDLWGFQNGAISKFLRCEFTTHKAMRSCAWCVENRRYEELHGCKVYESSIDPVLRFMHLTKITSAGWLNPGLCEPDADTTCDVKLWSHDWRLIQPVQRDDIAPLRIMSFDIECYSKTGAFPRPDNQDDVIFQIGMTTREFGKGYIDKTCLCLKETTGYPSFKTEKELLEAFQTYIIKMDPDIMTGWNIFGFDLEYLINRATIIHKLTPVWGRVRGAVSSLVIKELASSALGSNTLKMVPLKGRYVFDFFQDVKRDHKLESYSLNNVSKHFLNDQKNDMPVKEIFGRYADGDPDKLAEVADYCIKDTELPHQLLDRLNQIQNLVEMAKACWVPLAFLSERGQQIKVFSQMAYKALELNFMIPTIKSTPNGEGYQGATVLDAQTGAYYSPITALDFASLYPSIMCAENLCYSTCVMDPKYDNLPGVTYEQFGDYRFAQLPAPSLLPIILADLKMFRKKAKKDMAAAKGTPMESIYDGKQLAYKISMNSIYGFTGALKGILPLVAIAASTTMRGRQMICETKTYVEDNFPGAKVRYGDSVMPGTPVLIRTNGVISVQKIEDIGGEWIAYPGFMKIGTHKEQSPVTTETWTHQGWQPVRRLIRHKCKKKIYRILTYGGLVDVTEDHSLLGTSLEILKPTDIVPGRQLFHCFPQTPDMTYKDFVSRIHSANSIGFRRIKTTCPVRAQWYYMILLSMGYYVHIGYGYSIEWSLVHGINTCVREVKVLHESWDGYVYDIETDAGTFQAGIGQIIVKNTDSVMVEFDVQGRKGQDAIDYSWIQGELAAEQCSKLFKYPNNLELEKVYCPYFLYSKKRYAAKMYEGSRASGDLKVDFKKIDIKGLQVVRRDSCPFVRETLTTLLNMVLDSSDPIPVIEKAREAARKLMGGNVPMDKLMMSKKLGAEYKVKMAHAEVRDKMRLRDPGSEPSQGDRVSFVIVAGSGQMYEKAEDPAWVIKKKLTLDYTYYFTNQFKKPVQDLLEPLIASNIIFDKRFMVKTVSTTEGVARAAFLKKLGGS